MDPLFAVSANRKTQSLLQRIVQMSQHYMGIGTGGEASDSGESSAIALMQRRRNPPYVVFDVGANKGQYLRLLLTELDGSPATVHCFEPSRESFRHLSTAAVGESRVSLNNVGVGREAGEAVLHADVSGSGLASLTKRRLDHFGIDMAQAEQIRLTTIDAYCAANDIEGIDLLKLDIEGHELDALTGATRMFNQKRIGLVAFEFGGCNIDTRTFFQDFWYFFQHTGHDIFRMTPSGYLYPIKSYSEVHEQFRTANYLAVQRD